MVLPTWEKWGSLLIAHDKETREDVKDLKEEKAELRMDSALISASVTRIEKTVTEILIELKKVIKSQNDEKRRVDRIEGRQKIVLWVGSFLSGIVSVIITAWALGFLNI